MRQVPVARQTRALRRTLRGWRAAGDRVALVPTMGALHDGHLALAREGRKHADRVVVSIFVNPAQFGPSEDFSRYPRTFAEDRTRLAGLTDLIFAPTVDEMYPAGFATTVSLTGPAVVGLEDRFRPTHFQGVATVVAKLLIQAMPDVAVFGEKDYQQLLIVKRMVADLSPPVKILSAPIVREADGLALSSRNRYLSAEDRAKAPLIFKTLRACAEAIRNGTPIDPASEEARKRLERAGFEVDYLEARDAETLAPVNAHDRPLRLLTVARLGSTRLLDNIAV